MVARPVKSNLWQENKERGQQSGQFRRARPGRAKKLLRCLISQALQRQNSRLLLVDPHADDALDSNCVLRLDSGLRRCPEAAEPPAKKEVEEILRSRVLEGSGDSDAKEDDKKHGCCSFRKG
ncbi:hypothetical protein NL676_009344 [Syzygium grande]|nr:hypothetical protein NL676_009344 [Syzygium grande]